MRQLYYSAIHYHRLSIPIYNLARYLLVSTFISIALFSHQTVLAQADDRPRLEITGININRFPEVSVSVYGKNLGSPLANTAMDLFEDRTRQPVKRESADIGVQVAFVIDSSTNITTSGQTSVTRSVEIAEAVRHFILRGALSAKTDWLSAYYVTDPFNTFSVLVDWTQDHNSILNQLIQLPTNSLPKNTDIASLLYSAMDEFVNSPAPPNLQRSIVVFSDGTDLLSTFDLENILRRSQELDITIHVIHQGATEEIAINNLTRLAQRGGGYYIELSSIENVDPIWSEIINERTQRILTYHTTKSQPDEIYVTAPLRSGGAVDSLLDFPQTGVLPPSVIIQDTETRVLIDRNTNTDQLAIFIRCEIIWPDGYPRDLQRVEYRLGNRSIVVTRPLFTEVNFALEDLAPDSYTLTIKAVDEFGLVGEAQSGSFILIDSNTPIEAKPTLSPTSTTQPTQTASTATAVPLLSTPTVSGNGNSGGDGTDPPEIFPAQGFIGSVQTALLAVTGISFSATNAWLLLIFPALVLLLITTFAFRRRGSIEDDYYSIGSGDTNFGTGYVDNYGYQPSGRGGLGESFEYTEPQANPFDSDDATEPQQLLEGQVGFVPTYGNTLMGLAAHKPLTAEDRFSIT
ncbi:MAG: vWA domain-containing protein, partial [Chloroflexota bacterium]